MKIFITDETNLKKDDKFEFFVYGGLVVNEEDIKDLSVKLLSLKEDFDIDKDRPIKWNNINWNKKGELNPEIHKRIKDKIIDEIVNSNCEIIIYLSPNDFHHDSIFSSLGLMTHKFNQDKFIRTQKFAMNVCCFKFDQLLIRESQLGLVFADKFMDTINPELTNFCHGLYPNGGDYKYKNISMPIMQLDNEKSLLHQYNDVILGAINFSMREMSFNFLPRLKNSFYSVDGKINKYGINIYPKRTDNPVTRKQLERLGDKFNRLLSANDNI
jgi:hypothetical protein